MRVMISQTTILNAVKNICGSLLILGVGIFLFGVFGNASSTLVGIGIGTVMGAVFIFLMGVFFTVTQELLDKAHKPAKVVRHDNVIPFVRKTRPSHRI